MIDPAAVSPTMSTTSTIISIDEEVVTRAVEELQIVGEAASVGGAPPSSDLPQHHDDDDSALGGVVITADDKSSGIEEAVTAIKAPAAVSPTTSTTNNASEEGEGDEEVYFDLCIHICMWVDVVFFGQICKYVIQDLEMFFVCCFFHK